MVPKLHAKGSSFRGIAQYVLFDKGRADTSDRVEWTAVRNLAHEDPHVAWRLMAATAMDADRLKARAGVKNTGRKSRDAVLHLTLSWHPDESQDLDRDEMLRAVDGALEALGAQDRQVLIVAHSDEKQPHVHLVINRVSPEDGRMMSSSKEKISLSRWSEAYERERGELLCEQRAINNAARDRGEYVRGEKDVPRHIYELHAANQNRPDQAEHHRKQRSKDQAVGKRQRATRDRQARAWADLIESHKKRRSAILAQQKSDTLRAVEKIRQDYRRERWAPLHLEHRAETRAFERDEASFLGRMKNRLRAADFRALMRRDDRVGAIGRAFNALSSSGARRVWLEREQERREAALVAEQRGAERQAAREVRAKTRARLAEARHAFLAERASLVLTASLEAAKMRAEWNQRAEDRGADRSAAVEPRRAPDSGVESVKARLRKAREDRENGPDRPKRKR